MHLVCIGCSSPSSMGLGICARGARARLGIRARGLGYAPGGQECGSSSLLAVCDSSSLRTVCDSSSKGSFAPTLKRRVCACCPCTVASLHQGCRSPDGPLLRACGRAHAAVRVVTLQEARGLGSAPGPWAVGHALWGIASGGVLAGMLISGRQARHRAVFSATAESLER